ncbi:hypothetical protein DFH09DRAFT_1374185 [Mycena vulgaris]|nr:hypothetical protein DFH09DRAFT_1374185 [Mycena vulgaris]
MEENDVVAESTPLLAQNEDNLDPLGVRYLLIQHFSSAWGDRTAEFALYLYLIAYFKDTLLPSSIFGFAMTYTGLLGTLITVPLERRLGSARAGSWSIWSMVVCLLPVMASFYIFGPRNGLGTTLLFGGMALSRIGLWSFDLIQTKQLQDALSSHARRNTLTALQFTMQSGVDLLKYVLTMILSRPSQFRWAGLVSFLSVSSGAVVYLMYLKKERGHIFHPPLEWIRKIL